MPSFIDDDDDDDLIIKYMCSSEAELRIYKTTNNYSKIYYNGIKLS